MAYSVVLRSTNPARVRVPPGINRHAEYDYHFSDWVKLRDAIEGERAVKAAGQTYLPAREEQDDTEYREYLGRAVYYPATARTAEGLYGSVFRRPTRIDAPEKMADVVANASRDGRSLNSIVEDTLAEQLEVGRVGLLVDNPDSSSTRTMPYVAFYPAESIVDWLVVDEVVVAVLLLEFVPDDKFSMFPRESVECWRLLALDEDGYYYQATDKVQSRLTDAPVPPERRIYPDVNGLRLRRIPFTIINTDTVSPNVRKAPLLDLCNINYAHYRTYGVYENALYVQGTPIIYIRGPGTDGTFQPKIGPKVVWLLDKDDEPGIVEFTGSLQSHENSLEFKEAQMQSLGGKLIGQRKNAAARSAVSEDISIQGEEAVLLKIVQTCSDGMTRVLQDLAIFTRQDPTKCKVSVNEQFYRPKIGARELRSLISLFDAGLLPTLAAFNQLRESGFLDMEITYEQFASVAEEAREAKIMRDNRQSGIEPVETPKTAEKPVTPAKGAAPAKK